MKLFGLEIKRDKGLSYRGATVGGFGDSHNVSMNAYYKLYRGNSDLRRCVEEKQETVGKGGYEVVKGYSKERKIIEDPRIEEFLNKERPLEEFKSLLIRDLDVAANAFIEIIGNPNGQVVGFDLLDPRTMSIIADKYGNVIHYIQRVKGEAVVFAPEEILHIRDKIDMDNELFGISKVETLVYDLLGDKQAAITNYSFFNNNAIPASLVILDNELDQTEVTGAIENLKQQFSGGKNRHKVSIGNGIKDVKMIGTSSKDMEFYEYRKFNSERVCAVMGVPKTILNYTEGVNYSNADSQYTKFIENTIRPLERKVEATMTILLQLIAPEYRFEFIDSHINDLSERVEVVEKMLKNGLITPNEGREKLGMELLTEENASKPLILSNFTLLEDLDLNITPIKDETE